MAKEIIIKLTVKQAQSAWRLLSNVDAGCGDDVFLRSWETGCKRITKALLKAGHNL